MFFIWSFFPRPPTNKRWSPPKIMTFPTKYFLLGFRDGISDIFGAFAVAIIIPSLGPTPTSSSPSPTPSPSPAAPTGMPTCIFVGHQELGDRSGVAVGVWKKVRSPGRVLVCSFGHPLNTLHLPSGWNLWPRHAYTQGRCFCMLLRSCALPWARHAKDFGNGVRRCFKGAQTEEKGYGVQQFKPNLVGGVGNACRAFNRLWWPLRPTPTFFCTPKWLRTYKGANMCLNGPKVRI